jgi:PAS domain S-box-containing protein
MSKVKSDNNQIKSLDGGLPLEMREKLLRALVEIARDGLFIICRNRFEYVNPAFSATTGLSKEEILSKGLNLIVRRIPLEDRRKILARGRVIKSRKSARQIYKLRFFTKTGRLVHLELNTAHLPEGRIIGAVRDLTEMMEMRRRIRESESLYSQLIENARTPIVIVQDKKIKFINQAATSIFGYKKEDAIGLDFLNYLPENEVKRVVELYRQRMSGRPAPSPYELRVKHKDGHELFVEVEVGIIEYEGKPAELVIIHDITSRKKTEEKLREALEKLRRAFGATINVLNSLVEQKDPYTAGHHRRVSDLARSIAKEMGLSWEQVDGLRFAASIHDIGKVVLPAEILSRPGPLSENEWNLIKSHPQIGYDLLKDICFPWPIAEIIYQHHERLDGSGYPRGLKGEEIILEAKILAVADVVEAMSSHRPYRPAHSLEKALEEIEKNKGLLYDKRVVEACLYLFKEKNFKLK